MNKKRLIPLISILLVFSFIGLFFFYKRRKDFGKNIGGCCYRSA